MKITEFSEYFSQYSPRWPHLNLRKKERKKRGGIPNINQQTLKSTKCITINSLNYVTCYKLYIAKFYKNMRLLLYILSHCVRYCVLGGVWGGQDTDSWRPFITSAPLSPFLLTWLNKSVQRTAHQEGHLIKHNMMIWIHLLHQPWLSFARLS